MTRVVIKEKEPEKYVPKVGDIIETDLGVRFVVAFAGTFLLSDTKGVAIRWEKTLSELTGIYRTIKLIGRMEVEND